MNITQRQVNIGVFTLMTAGTLLLFIGEAVFGTNSLLTLYVGISVAVLSILFFAYWRGVEYARHTVVIITTLLVIFTQEGPFLNEYITLSIMIPPILALILTEPSWVIGSAILLYTGIAIRAGGQGVYWDPVTLVLYIMSIGGIILARLVTDTAHRKAEENARRAEQARAHAEHQARELAEANELMSEQLDQQGQLLDLVTTLETPVVPLADGMLFAPIVGHIDSRRAQNLTTRLLEQTSVQRARLVVLDIAGVAVVDTAVAQSLLHTVQALRLLGCEVILSGISASVALALIHLGVNLEEVRTVRSPQEALAQFLKTAPQAPSDQSKQVKKDVLLPIKPNGQVPNN
jgi:rsbT co-antagonist protein RsbR